MAVAPRAGFAQKSMEVSVPMRKDPQSFEARQKTIWEEMHEQMERRRAEWEEEVSDLKKDFFKLKPEADGAGGGGASGGSRSRGGSIGDNSLEKMNLNTMFYDKPGTEGQEKVFRVCFDVAQFNPDEISVRSSEGRLIVHARHEETNDGKMTSREFSRKVDIPQGIDPMSLRSTLSQDGILQVEADVPAPSYDIIRDEPGAPGGGSRLCALAHSPQALIGYMQGGQAQQPQALAPYVQQDGGKVFRVAVDIGIEFRPEELQVKTIDRKLVVHARHEEKTLGRTSCKEFNREFDLPDAVDPNQISANMTGDGKLVLQAPFIAGF